MAKTRKQRKHKQNAWGYHLIIDAGKCDPKAIRSKAIIAKFAKDLVTSIDMVAFGPPRVVHFGSGHTTGYTLIQLIQTSCITAHFAEDTNSIFFDCFSCKTFDPAIAKQVFQKYFGPKTMKTKFFERQPWRYPRNEFRTFYFIIFDKASYCITFDKAFYCITFDKAFYFVTFD